jgi:hypothetical protein
MTRGWVSELGPGQGLFTAQVEYGGSEPFSVLPGPHAVELEEALGWARAYAERVSVRLGGDFYSAGREQIETLPEWTGPYPDPRPADREGPLLEFRAEAQTAWFRNDRAEVARRLAEALDSLPTTSDVIPVPTQHGFRVGFTVFSPSPAAARELSFRVVREAWKASGIEARGGDDFDADELRVTAGG